ncbi:vitamin K-dependent protein C [Octopus sinensis]|uniref:Vitamin K-dependent protein C n=1 Tax=Octopus sinensis TaxID=2607531 RepID=A0A6P7THE7_9MOLL|nr:vitamin K-dependent protein C [Octopus sinensis]
MLSSVCFLLTLALAYTNAGEEQIVAGKPAKACQFPSIVHLLFDTNDGSFACGGTLLSNRHILTASHCFAKGTHTIRARIGDIDVEHPSVLTINAESWAMHPRFTDTPMRNDVAIIRLESPVTFSNCIKSSPLPPSNKVYDGKKCIAAGWGALGEGKHGPATLHHVAMPVINHEQCKKTMSYADLQKQHLCAGDFKDGGPSTCMGDSGGPLYCPDRGTMVVAGITSFGYGCEFHAAIFTDVSYYRQWILDTMEMLD